ncbi:hypothetical protein PI124_g13926 [Phytophthora idaei]|nr:hypothetical protein PI125_g16637 [Phytophthora idaei]KAG3151221.1 hypothetical protein PI126_g11112 [Phytophthora idaei]KAG3241201.1 hypothetical protein PI124_g13926 [Phytophthora idaei]
MEVPFGIVDAEEYVCLFKKAVYRLNQAAKAGNKTIHHVFLQNGFKSCGAGQCGYFINERNGQVYECLYVDDIIIDARTSGEIREVMEELKNDFKIKEMRAAKFILGMEIGLDRTARTLLIKQTRYIDDVVERFGQQHAKIDNPCASGLKLSILQSPGTSAERDEIRSRLYRSLIGCLLYITTCTRPDIA